jgi:hypothetical protein
MQKENGISQVSLKCLKASMLAAHANRHLHTVRWLGPFYSVHRGFWMDCRSSLVPHTLAEPS